MAKLDLSIYGITDVEEVLHNPSYEELYKAETDPKLEGYEKGYLTELGAVNVMTGIYTGRSPKDKFFVERGQRGFLYSGLLTNTRTTTSLVRKKHGQFEGKSRETIVRQKTVRG